jgi:hypothetical protein
MMDDGDMSERQGFEQKMRAELAQLKVEYENLKARAGRVESELMGRVQAGSRAELGISAQPDQGCRRALSSWWPAQ